MAVLSCLKSIFHEKHYLSRDNSARFAATSSMRETLCATLEKPIDIMKILIKILTFAWIIFWVSFGIIQFQEPKNQNESVKVFVNERLRPAVKFVSDFRTENNHLPNNREFDSWERNYYKDYSSPDNVNEGSSVQVSGLLYYIRNDKDFHGEDNYKFKDADWSKDFVIGVWRGEWMEYYFSWNNTYDTNNNLSANTFVSFQIILTLTILPIMFWGIYWFKRKRKAAHNSRHD